MTEEEIPIVLSDEELMEVEAYAKQHDLTLAQAAARLVAIGMSATLAENSNHQRRRDEGPKN